MALGMLPMIEDASLRRRVQLLERLRQHRDVRRAVVEITQAALRLAVAQ